MFIAFVLLGAAFIGIVQTAHHHKDDIQAVVDDRYEKH